jgi:hypothetical protein
MPIAQISGSAGLHGDFKEFSPEELATIKKGLKAQCMALAGKRGEEIGEQVFQQLRAIHWELAEEHRQRRAFRMAQKDMDTPNG